MLFEIFLCVLLARVAFTQNPSPCRDILTYETSGAETGRWYATVTLTSRKPLQGIWLRITLDRPAELLGNVFGDATTTDNREFLITSPNYILEPGSPTPIKFFVKYNAARVVPSVARITLNDDTICPLIVTTTEQSVQTKPTRRRTTVQKSPSNNRPSTNFESTENGGSFTTENNYRPTVPTNNRLNTNYDGNTRPTPRPVANNRPITDYIETNTRPTNYRPSSNNFNARPTSNYDDYTTSRPTNNVASPFGNNRDPDDTYIPNNNNNNNNNQGTTSEESLEFFQGDFSAVVSHATTQNNQRPLFNQEQQCGTVATQPTPLISFGQNTTPGQWPWHAALYHFKGTQLIYTCGGSLISTTHVVTAAHCVTKPNTNTPINRENMLVHLGKYILKKFGSETQEREVSNIFVHPEYNHTRFYNDISIIKLSEPVRISNYVRPVCLWDEDVDLQYVEGKDGTVVGWGFDEHREISSNLMQAKMPIVSTVTCIFSNRNFFSQFTSETSYCAGFRNGTSVCNGDSGSGMVFPKTTRGSNTIWQLRGLVSVGVALQGKGICDASQYVIFTDVAKCLDWIQTILRNYP